VRSSLEVFDLAAGARVVLQTDRLINAPNWSPDGTELLVNAEGGLWRVPLAAPALLPVDTGGITRCNNDHGYSPDGQWIVFSAHHRGLGAEIYRMPRQGGQAGLISPAAPSWWHGFSPDGCVMVYAAVRAGGTIDIYRCPAQGGPETRLTKGEGHADGPEFSADGRAIYFNSDRSGHAQIWVMAADGTGQRALFSDACVNWFPHPSPDGQHLIYLAYPAGTMGHPADLPVQIMLCDTQGGNRRDIVSLNGGQGTINVPNWSPDGRAFAFIRYG
jgi:Tol biopolymer transport system component